MGLKYRRIENDTPLIPEIVADCVITEAGTLIGFQTITNPEELARHLVARANAVYNSNERFHKQIRGKIGREYLYSFMRHWTAGWVKDNLGNDKFQKLGLDFPNGVFNRRP